MRKRSKQDPEPIEQWSEEKIRAVAAEVDAPGHYTFKQGVKAITQEATWVRALPWFRRFLRSMLDTDEQFYRHLEHATKTGFATVRVGLWASDFKQWKVGYKSGEAKKSRTVGIKKQQSERAKQPRLKKKQFR